MQMHMHISHLYHFYLFWGDRSWDLRGSIGKLPGPIGPHGLERKSKVKSALQPNWIQQENQNNQQQQQLHVFHWVWGHPCLWGIHCEGCPTESCALPRCRLLLANNIAKKNKWRIYPNFHRHKILNLTPDSCHHHHNHLHPDHRFGTRTFISLHTFGFCWQMSNEYFAEYFLNISQNIV